MMKQLTCNQAIGDVVLQAVQNNIAMLMQAMDTGGNVIQASMNALSLQQLQKIYNSLSSGNQDHKIAVCAREIFNQEISNISLRKTHLAAAEAAMNHAVSVAFYNSYMSDDGTLNMQLFSTDLLAVICSKQPVVASPGDAGM